jgi:hypothetical protein
MKGRYVVDAGGGGEKVAGGVDERLRRMTENGATRKAVW